MQQAIYKQAQADGIANAYIAQRKLESAVKFDATHQRQRQRKALLKQGRAYILKNKAELYWGDVGGYPVTAGALLKTANNLAYYRAAYTICSNKDAPSRHVARGIVGVRLESDEPQPFAFNITMPNGGAIKPIRLMRIVETHIMMDLLAPRVPGPQRLLNNLAKDAAIRLVLMEENLYT
jgi:hypothetical protein